MPKRPKAVPRKAKWNSVDSEWDLVELDAKGRRVGPCLSWSADGVLVGESFFERGLMHGLNRRFAASGSVTSVGEFRRGKIFSSVFFRAAAPTLHDEFEVDSDVASNVTIAMFFSHNGKTNCGAMYLTREGREVTFDGHLLPPRPACVPPHAQYDQENELWGCGEKQRGPVEEPNVGTWSYWSADGSRRQTIRFSKTGRVLERSPWSSVT